MILEIAVEPAVVDIILGVEAEVKNARWTVCETVVIGDLKVKKKWNKYHCISTPGKIISSI